MPHINKQMISFFLTLRSVILGVSIVITVRNGHNFKKKRCHLISLRLELIIFLPITKVVTFAFMDQESQLKLFHCYAK